MAARAAARRACSPTGSPRPGDAGRGRQPACCSTRSLAVAGVLGALTVPHLFAVALLTGVGAGVFAPAEMSAVRTVVPTEQLPTALSQHQARQHVANLVGGPLGGVLYAVDAVAAVRSSTR